MDFLSAFSPLPGPAAFWIVFILLTSFFCYHVVYNIYFHPLRNVPGPFAAKISSFHLLGTFLRGQQHVEQMEFHNKYGPIVRVAPSLVIVNDPAVFPLYFNWSKALFSRAFRAHPVHVSHSTELDVEMHKIRKKNVMPAYQMSAVIKNESKVDKHIVTLVQRLRERTDKVMDFAAWTQYTAFDIVMEMVFSNPLGFLENAKDVNGLIKSIHELITAAMIPAMFPFLSKLMYHPWLFPYIAPKPTDPTGPGRIHGLAYSQVRTRFENLQDSTTRYKDILQGLIEKSGSKAMSPEVLEQESVNPILAGSDSVGAHLRAVVLYTATTPRVLAKLQAQIDVADNQGLLSEIPQFDEIKKYVPYVELVHKEAMRIYPIVGGYLPREVPKGGATVCGHYLPAGTDVGVSQWAVSRNPKIWGDDFKIFRPERWENPAAEKTTEETGEAQIDHELDTSISHSEKVGSLLLSNEEEDSARTARKLRDSGNIFFSSGPMMCTGRHIALLEIYKVITQIFREFDVQIVDPTRPWKEVNKLGMFHRDFWVVLTERKRREKKREDVKCVRNELRN